MEILLDTAHQTLCLQVRMEFPLVVLYVFLVVWIQLLSIMIYGTIDDGSCAYCTDNYLTLNMYDSFGDGWNGNTLTMTNSSGAMMVSQTLANGSAGTGFFMFSR